jgi:hypothetical protein
LKLKALLLHLTNVKKSFQHKHNVANKVITKQLCTVTLGCILLCFNSAIIKSLIWFIEIKAFVVSHIGDYTEKDDGLNAFLDSCRNNIDGYKYFVNEAIIGAFER